MNAPADSGSSPRLRVVLCTCDSWFGTVVLARLLNCDGLCVVGVVRSSRVLSTRFGFLRGAAEQIRRSGLPYSCYLFVATAVSDTVCRPRLAKLAQERAIPTMTTRDVNDAGGRRLVAQWDPDLLVSAFFNQRLSEELLAVPRFGGVNIHPSLLPQFRGADPVFHARLRGAQHLGVTLHRMSPGLDEGAILAQETLCLPRATVFDATAQLFERGAGLLIERLGQIERHDAGIAQTGLASYDSWPTAAQVRQFHSQGGELVRVADLARRITRTATAALMTGEAGGDP